MSDWKIIIPETAAVTNIVTNPSIETATTGYTASGAGCAIAQSTTQTRRGAQALAVTPTATTSDGVYYLTSSLANATAYTFSVDVWAALGVAMWAYFASTVPTIKGTPTTFTGTGNWQRVTVTWTTDAAAAFRLYVTKAGSASTAIFYIDGLLLVADSHDITYFDGDTAGCKWLGTKHASTSQCPVGVRAIGREYDLLDDYGTKVMTGSTLGMPPQTLFTMPYSLLPGSEFEGRKIGERYITLASAIEGTSGTNLHSKRKLLINAMKHDLVRGDQQFILRYYGASTTRPIQINCVYAGGLEFNSSPTYMENAPIALVATDPFWYEDGEASAALTTSLTVENADYAVKKLSGTWSNINTAFNGNVYAIVKGQDGSIYIGGNFTDVGGANGDYIVQYDPIAGTLSALGTGMSGGAVQTLAVAPNGDIYAGGEFTLAGGVADTVRIAYWDIDAAPAAWKPLSTGISSGAVYKLVFGQDGTLYIGGSFQDVGGANGDRLVKWNGTIFSALGTGMDQAVRDLAIAPNGNLYVAGEFTTGNGVTLNKIGYWNGTTFLPLGTGLSGGGATGSALVFDNSGYLYVAGDFTSADGVSCSYIAKWNGQTFEPLGAGLDSSALELAKDINELIYVGGIFTSAGGLALADRMALWNGTTWAHINANLPSTPTVYAILCDGEDLYIGYSTSGSATTSYKNTVTNNGIASTYPRIVFKRSGGTSAVLEYIKNETTGDTLWCNHSLLDGETLTIDLTPEKKTVTSDFFGNVIGRAILRNSDKGTFHLQPGSNDISVFINAAGSPTLTAYMTWPITHHSFDGTAA